MPISSIFRRSRHLKNPKFSAPQGPVADLDHVKRVNSHGQFFAYKFMTISFGVSTESLNTIYFTIKIPLVRCLFSFYRRFAYSAAPARPDLVSVALFFTQFSG